MMTIRMAHKAHSFLLLVAIWGGTQSHPSNNSTGTAVRANRNALASEGSSVQLRCDTPGYQEISWSRDKQPLPQRASLVGPILRIDNLQLEDAGRYICRTTAHSMTAEDYIDLRVETVHNDVELQIVSSQQEVYFGDTVDLRCVALGPSNVRLYWSKANAQLPVNARQTGPVLRITQATLDNNGTYRCTAILNNNRYDKDFILSVFDRPTHDVASAETASAEYGHTIDLKCAINLEGPISYTWTKHGGVLPASAQISGPHLTISTVTDKDAGLYICTASNGNVHVNIPKIILVKSKL